MNLQRLGPRKWQYKENGKYYEIIISEELEHFLNKQHNNPDFQEDIGIVKIKNQPIEKILERIVGENKNQDYDFDTPDIHLFRT